MHNLIPLFFEGKRIVAFTSNNVPWFHFNDVLDALGMDDWDEKAFLPLKEHERAIADVVDSDIEGQMMVINLSGLCKVVSFSNPEIGGRFMWWVCAGVLPSTVRPGHAVFAEA
jgi:prophage antirepressor-like protein